jgi:hypothetical protein
LPVADALGVGVGAGENVAYESDRSITGRVRVTVPAFWKVISTRT